MCKLLQKGKNIEWAGQCRIKVGAIDAAALGLFVK